LTEFAVQGKPSKSGAFQRIIRFTPQQATVLLQGESGTGKE
jgi:transcriptional regulator with PAS, ATPase and Fis domain